MTCDALPLNPFSHAVMKIDTIGTFNTTKAVYNKYFQVSEITSAAFFPIRFPFSFLQDRGGVIVNISATLHYTGTALQVVQNSAIFNCKEVVSTALDPSELNNNSIIATLLSLSISIQMHAGSAKAAIGTYVCTCGCVGMHILCVSDLLSFPGQI